VRSQAPRAWASKANGPGAAMLMTMKKKMQPKPSPRPAALLSALALA
jgi:hypothetical protein